MDLKTFLLARIDEDEAAAKAAFGEPFLSSVDDGVWEANTSSRSPNVTGTSYFSIEGGDPDCMTEGQAAHIARHDPARVLAECAAKRAIIDAQHWEPQVRPTDTELHARAAHPAYEYETTEGPRKQWDNPEEPPEGEGWEPNTAKGYRDGWARLEYTEESYWRRLKPEAERKEWKQYIPIELRALAAVYADHPDYQPEWKLSL